MRRNDMFIDCPECGESNYHEYDYGDFDLGDKLGSCYIDYHCENCGKDFRVNVKFTYNIVEWRLDEYEVHTPCHGDYANGF